MSTSQSAARARRRTRSSVLPVLGVVAALTGVVACRSLAGSSLSAAPPIVVGPSAQLSQDLLPGDAPGRLRGDRHGALDVADGEVPDGVTVFNDEFPAVTELDRDLLGALRAAASDAADDGVEFYVNSGWRSERYQATLFEQAVSSYGSDARAAHWVARPGTSAHETGAAVDLGHSSATSWLSEHGAEYGLCQIYRNEPWHYELRPEAVDHGCPRMYPDSTKDPRMRGGAR